MWHIVCPTCFWEVFFILLFSAYILQGGMENMVSSGNYKEILGHRVLLVFSAKCKPWSKSRRVWSEKTCSEDIVYKHKHAISLEKKKVLTLGGMGSCDVFWYPSDGGMITLRIPPTFIDLTATSIPAIT